MDSEDKQWLARAGQAPRQSPRLGKRDPRMHERSEEGAKEGARPFEAEGKREPGSLQRLRPASETGAEK